MELFASTAVFMCLSAMNALYAGFFHFRLVILFSFEIRIDQDYCYQHKMHAKSSVVQILYHYYGTD